MTGSSKPCMNKGIYIRRACFGSALDFAVGYMMSIASVAKLPDLLKKISLASCGHFGRSEALLDEPEAPVGGKHGVACDQEVKVQTGGACAYQAQYQSTNLFWFWPLQLSQFRSPHGSPTL